jgi:hypothetical protein
VPSLFPGGFKELKERLPAWASIERKVEVMVGAQRLVEEIEVSAYTRAAPRSSLPPLCAAFDCVLDLGCPPNLA